MAAAHIADECGGAISGDVYATHKCNLVCSYCTQKEPGVFSDELSTRETIRLLRRIRKETDSIVMTDGEPTLRADIKELADEARFHCKFRSVLLITIGTLLDRKPAILNAVTGLVSKIIERRRRGAQPINGTPRTIETWPWFRNFQCYPTMFPRVYPNGDVFYPCEPLRKVAGNLLRDESLKKIFARGKRIYGEIPPCQGICYLFGNAPSHYYAMIFGDWQGSLCGDRISRKKI